MKGLSAIRKAGKDYVLAAQEIKSKLDSTTDTNVQVEAVSEGFELWFGYMTGSLDQRDTQKLLENWTESYFNTGAVAESAKIQNDVVDSNSQANTTTNESSLPLFDSFNDTRELETPESADHKVEKVIEVLQKVGDDIMKKISTELVPIEKFEAWAKQIKAATAWTDVRCSMANNMAALRSQANPNWWDTQFKLFNPENVDLPKLEEFFSTARGEKVYQVIILHLPSADSSVYILNFKFSCCFTLCCASLLQLIFSCLSMRSTQLLHYSMSILLDMAYNLITFSTMTDPPR